MNRSSAAALLVVAGTVIGCGPTTRNYDVAIRNDGLEPVTLVLTKNGPPMENGWLPPEDLAAMLHAPPEYKVNGIVLKPGMTARPNMNGKFDAGTAAMLRVYRGDIDMRTMLGVGPDSPNRTDIQLAPGANTVVIDKTGKAARQ